MKDIKRSSAIAGKQPMANKQPKDTERKESGEDNCRCKEASKKTPLELLKLMLNDLAFWKK